jgi:hypothetical protein
MPKDHRVLPRQQQIPFGADNKKANAKADFSATQRTVRLCAAPVEMTHLSWSNDASFLAE